MREKAFQVLAEVFPTWARYIEAWDGLTSGYLAALEEWGEVKGMLRQQRETPKGDVLHRWMEDIQGNRQG